MRKVLKYGLLFLLWGGVAAYVVYAAYRAGAVRRALTVRDIAIEVRDSIAHGNLVSTPAVRGWIAGSGIPTLGARACEVDLRALERLIARNGFVDRVNAHVTYDGVLRVEVSQREPLLRLLVDGYDVYVTGQGYVFPAPRASSVYVPVVTGGYRPPFPAGYGGDLAASLRKELERSEEAIAGMEREKYPFFRRERRNDENIRALRRMTIRKGWFEADEKFDERVAALRRHKAELRRRYRYEEQCIEAGIQAIVRRQEAERARQKKLEKRYEDFWKLITFVKQIQEDDFWQAEIVQIVASTAPSGTLEVELVPRSGDFVVRFGRLEQVAPKLDRLTTFYREGFPRVGWDAWRIVDVRFDGRVVCSN